MSLTAAEQREVNAIAVVAGFLGRHGEKVEQDALAILLEGLSARDSLATHVKELEGLLETAVNTLTRNASLYANIFERGENQAVEAIAAFADATGRTELAVFAAAIRVKAWRKEKNS